MHSIGGLAPLKPDRWLDRCMGRRTPGGETIFVPGIWPGTSPIFQRFREQKTKRQEVSVYGAWRVAVAM